MTSNASGLATWETVSGAGGTLDQAYDFGGAGIGRTVFADAGVLNIAGSDGLLVTGTYGSGLSIGSVNGIPEGAGTRMFFNPRKAAFRVGGASSTQWDNVNTGDYSSAIGPSTIASGYCATSIGYITTASGVSSLAMGERTTASGQNSTAMGYLSVASSYASTAMGYQTTASNFYSTAMGIGSVASGEGGTAIGNTSTASGIGSIAMGYVSTASGYCSNALGWFVTASGQKSLAMGTLVSTNNMDGSFIFGDNSAFLSSSTAPNQFMTRFSGGYVFYTNSATTVGVSLAAGGNSWASISDKFKKENFLAINSEEVLHKIANFSQESLGSWNYIGQNKETHRHYGVMAQDFYKAFGMDGIGKIGNDTTLASADFDGISFIAIHGLEKRTSHLDQEIQNLKAQIQVLIKQNEDLIQEIKSIKTITNKD